LASHPGLAIVQTMVTQSGPGSASLAASWASTYGLTNVHVWGDTSNYMYYNYTSQPSIDGYYPSTLIIDVDTMTMTVLQQAGVSTLGSAIDAILDAEHPCADY
jgi:hypothetical protein